MQQEAIHVYIQYYRAADGKKSSSAPQSKKRNKGNEGPVSGASRSAGYPLSTRRIGLSAWPARGDSSSLNGTARALYSFETADEARTGARMPSEHGSTSGGEEEVDKHTKTRILKDGMGRLVYIGSNVFPAAT